MTFNTALQGPGTSGPALVPVAEPVPHPHSIDIEAAHVAEVAEDARDEGCFGNSWSAIERRQCQRRWERKTCAWGGGLCVGGVCFAIMGSIYLIDNPARSWKNVWQLKSSIGLLSGATICFSSWSILKCTENTTCLKRRGQ